MVLVWPADYLGSAQTFRDSRAIANVGRSLWHWIALYLDKLRIVDLGAKGVLYCAQIGPVRVCGQLDAISARRPARSCMK